MEEAQERKKKFVILLLELLDRSEGVKGKLAQKLKIKPSTLTPWLQGKIDPASLEILVFERLAKLAGHNIDSLAKLLTIIDTDKQQNTPQEQFKNLIEQILVIQSREELAKRLGIRQATISNWLNLEKNIHPENMPVDTLAAIAIERGWTLERLLAYLNLKKDEAIEEDIIALIQSQTKQLSFSNRVKLLSWLSGDFEKELSSFNKLIFNHNQKKSISNKKILFIFEKEDLAISNPSATRAADADLSLAQRVSHYTADLITYLEINPDNLQVTTIPKLPQSLDNIDVLIFDISTADSPSIALIEQISFDGDIVVFTSENLPENVRAGLEDKVTDVLVKPINWSSLRDKEYFR